MNTEQDPHFENNQSKSRNDSSSIEDSAVEPTSSTNHIQKTNLLNHSQMTHSPESTDNEQVAKINAYEFPSFSNLIPKNTAPNQTNENSVQSLDNHQTANLNKSNNQLEGIQIEHPESAELTVSNSDSQTVFDNSQFQNQSPLETTNISNELEGDSSEIPAVNTLDEDQSNLAENDQLNNDSILNQTIRSDSTWPRDDSAELQNKVTINPKITHFNNPELIPELPANYQQSQSDEVNQPQEFKVDFDPSLIKPQFDQGKLPLADPTTPEILEQPRRGFMIAITGLLVIVLIGGAYFYWRTVISNNGNGTPRIIAAIKTPMKEFPKTDENNSDQNEGGSFFAIINSNGSEIEENLIVPEQTRIPTLPDSITSEFRSRSVQPVEPSIEKTVTVRPDGSRINEAGEPIPNEDQIATVGTSIENIISETDPDESEIKIAIPAPNNSDIEDPKNTPSTDLNNEHIPDVEIAIPYPKLKPEIIQQSSESAIVTNQPVELIANESTPSNNEIPQVGTISKGTPVVQILAERSIEGAQQGFIKLKQKHPDIFEGLTPIIQETGDNSWFRVRIKMASSSAATEFCNKLEAQALECYIPPN